MPKYKIDFLKNIGELKLYERGKWASKEGLPKYVLFHGAGKSIGEFKRKTSAELFARQWAVLNLKNPQEVKQTQLEFNF